jgi:hypothetical protein
MKKHLIILTIIYLARLSFAELHLTSEANKVHTVGEIVEKAQNILIVQCAAPRQFGASDGNVATDINVISVLKGDAKPGPSRLLVKYWPKQDEVLLIFSEDFVRNNEYYSGYDARGEERIVPIPSILITNYIAGKPLKEQVKLIYTMRLHDVNLELKKVQTEKKRLEDALKEPEK